MDVLIDIIVLIVKSLSKPQQAQLPKLTPQQAAAQQAAMQQRLAAMQKAAQQARVPQPKGVHKPIAAKAAAPGRPALAARSPLAAALPMTKTATPVPAPRRSDARGMLVPLILGEILAPPLALREPEV